MQILNETDYNVALAQGGVLLITQPSWCVPCQRLEPHWAEVQETLAETDIATHTLNLDDVDSMEWVAKTGVRSVPTLMLNGNPIRARTARGIVDEVLAALDNEPPF